MNNGHILIYSGVPQEESAKSGVGCVIHRSLEHSIADWNCINGRIMTIKIKYKDCEALNLIITYGPNEDERKALKDEYWEDLQSTLEKVDDVIYIVGDFNGRVGDKNRGIERIMNVYGEEHKNNNGERLIDFCLVNDLKILNRIFKHKDIHKYTRWEPSRNEKSLIDYAVTNVDNAKNVKDVRVYRSYEIGSDHFLLITKILIYNNGELNKVESIATQPARIKINIEKLKIPEIQEKYQNGISDVIHELPEPNQHNVEHLWSHFKTVVHEASKRACGLTRVKGNKKRTSWWDKSIADEVKKKKQLWKKYLSTKDQSVYDLYKAQTKTVKKLILIAKKKSWNEFGETLETNFKENQKLFYNVIKNTSKKRVTIGNQIKDMKGSIITEDKKIMQRWKTYFEELLDASNQITNSQGATESIDTETKETEEDHQIEYGEIKRAVDKLRTGKAAGQDGIKPEQVKYIGESGLLLLTLLFKKILEYKKIPREWETAIIFPIFKKGDRMNCSNYRGISLICTTAKLLESVLENKLRSELDRTIEPSQSGLRKGYSIQDHIFVLRHLTHQFLTHNKSLFVAFIDLIKAFDKVNREKLWKILENRGVSNKLIAAIKRVYATTRNVVRTGNLMSEEFCTYQGLRQGGSLSPFLFTIYLDEISKRVHTKIEALRVGYHKLEIYSIHECAFADDLAIFARSEEELQLKLNVWNEELTEFDMEISAEKTKVMAITKSEIRMNIQLETRNIEQVETFKYLGSLINSRGDIGKEIDNRLIAANKSYFGTCRTILNNRKISKRTKTIVYKTVYQSVLLHGCETWVLNNKYKSKVQAAEMKYLRKIEGVTKLDRVRNEVIREKLGIKPILSSVEERQLNWFGHLVRMPENRQTKKIWRTRQEGKRQRGRPSKSWDKVIDEILKAKNINKSVATRLAMDRNKWRVLTKDHK